MDKRVNTPTLENIFLGILCGMLMYIAVNYFVTAPWVTTMCVAAFILLGTNHCIADMAYMLIAYKHETMPHQLLALIGTTIGNVIGCNIIPFFVKISNQKNET